MSEKIEVLSAVHGIAPRSDELLILGGNVERGRVPQSEYAELLSAESEDWLNLQTDAGIDLRGDAKLDWQDHLRLIVKASAGFASDIDNAPVIRWFETNTFYRQPTIIGPLSPRPEKLLETIRPIDGYVNLLGPKTFAELCENQSPVYPLQNTLALYKNILSSLEYQGVERVHLSEFASQKTFPGRIMGSVTVKHLAESLPSLKFSHTSFGCVSTYSEQDNPTNLAAEIIAGSIHRFLERQAEGEIFLKGRELWSQVIRSDTTLLDKLDISRWPKADLQALEPAGLVITHGFDLQLVPLAYAQEKVKRLGEFAAELRDELGV